MKFHDVIGENAVVAAYEGAWTKLEMVLIT
jgi:hypothetical protein